MNSPNTQKTPTGSDTLTEVGPDIFDSLKDTQGRFRTQSLFWEYRHDAYPALFTLKKQDAHGKISMYRKYMEIGDPTEYKVAIQLLGSWEHWQALQRSKWFTEELSTWRSELKTRMESDRYHEMVANIDDPKTTVQATKWLAARYGAPDKDLKKRGRPSKVELENHKRRLVEASEDLDEDALRIGLKK